MNKFLLMINSYFKDNPINFLKWKWEMILRCTQSDKFKDFCDESLGYFKSHSLFSILSKSSLGSMMNLNVQILLGQRKVYINLAVFPQGWILPLGTSIWYLWFMRKMQRNMDRLKPLLRNLRIRLWLLFHLLNALYTAHLLTLLLITWVCTASLVSFNTNYNSLINGLLSQLSQGMTQIWL